MELYYGKTIDGRITKIVSIECKTIIFLFSIDLMISVVTDCTDSPETPKFCCQPGWWILS
jgi:hypothetical protein